MVPAQGAPLPQGKQVVLSKALSKLLRHHAAQRGLEVDSAGYVPLQQVLQIRKLPAWVLLRRPFRLLWTLAQSKDLDL